MPRLLLDVPLVKQDRSMECWYASACMVCYYREAGPRLGLPKKWEANQGIDPEDFVALAKTEGMKPYPLPISQWTSASLCDALRFAGPLWCAGYWFGVPHIVVLTGVDGNTIYINDPDGPTKRTNTVDWFNTKLAFDVKDPVLYKPRS